MHPVTAPFSLLAAMLVIGAEASPPQTPVQAEPVFHTVARPIPDSDPSNPEAIKLIPIEKELAERTNAERVRYGLPPLLVDRRLMESARAHCAWMTNNYTLQHTRQAVAENIAMGQQTSDEAIRSWMSSPGHRANILNPRHRRLGVAAYRSPHGTVFWCQQFMP